MPMEDWGARARRQLPVWVSCRTMTRRTMAGALGAVSLVERSDSVLCGGR